MRLWSECHIKPRPHSIFLETGSVEVARGVGARGSDSGKRGTHGRVKRKEG